jgi:hypothetical protein
MWNRGHIFDWHPRPMPSLRRAILYRIRSSLCSATLPSLGRPKVSDRIFKSAISVSSKLSANSSINVKSSAYLKVMCWRPPYSRRRWNPVRRGSRRGETCLPVSGRPEGLRRGSEYGSSVQSQAPPELEIPAGFSSCSPIPAGSVSELKPLGNQRDARRRSLPALLIDSLRPDRYPSLPTPLEENGNGRLIVSNSTRCVLLGRFNSCGSTLERSADATLRQRAA